MAPTVPKLSASEHRMARLRGDIHKHAPYKVHREDTTTSDTFASSKRDKRQIKSASFASKIVKANTKPSRNQTRRSKNKLKTTLNSLADALPELDSDEEAGRPSTWTADGKIRHKSLKSRPGALKRKEKIVKKEMERFGASMAQLASVVEREPVEQVLLKQKLSRKKQRAQGQQGGQTQPQPVVMTSTSNRWAALRGFIVNTMEQNPAFAGQ